MLLGASRSLVAVIVLHLVGFFFAALLGHSRLAQSRPAPSHLTEFYLVVSVGGALGGAVTALVARSSSRRSSSTRWPSSPRWPCAPGWPEGCGRPAASTRTIGPVAVVAGVLVLALLVSATGAPEGIAMTAGALGVAALVASRAAGAPRAFAAAIAVLSVLTVLPAADTLVTDRSFFGVTRVRIDDRGRHQLMSGSTLHGVQDLDAADPLRPLVHYFPEGPIGQHFRLADPHEITGDRARVERLLAGSAAPQTTSPSTRSTRRSCASPATGGTSRT